MKSSTLGEPAFMPAEYGEAVAIETWGVGTYGIEASGSAAEETLGLAAASSPVDGLEALSAWSRNPPVSKKAKAAVAIILLLNFIVASRIARHDHQKSERRVNSTRLEHATYRTCLKPR